MIQNYFFLNRYIIEADELISGGIITGIFSQEKNKLVICVVKRNTEYFIEINVTPAQSYFRIRKDYSKARKNTLLFFEELNGKKINSLLIADDDRIIKINCQEGDLYFAIRGKFTNVYFINGQNEAESFKLIQNEELNSLKTELLGKRFTGEFNIPVLPHSDLNNYPEKIRRVYPIIGKDILNELSLRNIDNSKTQIEKILTEIRTVNPIVYADERNFQTAISFSSFNLYPLDLSKTFTNLIDAQNYYLSIKFNFEEKYRRLKLINKHIEKESSRLSFRIIGLQSVIKKGSSEDKLNKNANLLLINLKSIDKGKPEVILDDIFTGSGKIKIKLDPKISIQKNIELYFEKSKAEKIKFQKSKELIEKYSNDLKKLKQVLQKIKMINTMKELDAIMKELKLKQVTQQKATDNISDKFKRYIIDGKYHVFVGKDSKNNDLLTTKFAKQNDYWFHARSVSGSHVVLRIDNSKEAIPKNVLKKAASLAAFHSKAKTSGLAPVSYTFKKYVVKKKGFPAGTVHLLREDTLLVKPEIPAGCEFVNKD